MIRNKSSTFHPNRSSIHDGGMQRNKSLNAKIGSTVPDMIEIESHKSDLLSSYTSGKITNHPHSVNMQMAHTKLQNAIHQGVPLIIVQN